MLPVSNYTINNRKSLENNIIKKYVYPFRRCNIALHVLRKVASTIRKVCILIKRDNVRRNIDAQLLRFIQLSCHYMTLKYRKTNRLKTGIQTPHNIRAFTFL